MPPRINYKHTQHLQKIGVHPKLKREAEDHHDDLITLDPFLIDYIMEREPVKSQDAYTRKCVAYTLNALIGSRGSINVETLLLAEIVLEYCK